MDASLLTNYRRAQTLFAFNEDLQPNTNRRDQPVSQPLEASVATDTRRGGFGLIRNSQIIIPAATPETPTLCYLDDLLNWVFLEELAYCAKANLGPTRGSRFTYIFVASIAQAYNWVQPILTDTKDGWNWDLHNRTESEMETYVFMNHALIAMLPNLIPSYNTAPLSTEERDRFQWTPEQQTTYVNTLKAKTKFDTWFAAWTTWWNKRKNDGSIAASVPPTASQLPNGSTTLDPLYKKEFSNAAYPNIEQWTPLVVRSATQKWLTWNWNNVSTTCLTTANESTIKGASAAYFPTDRRADIDSLVSTVTQMGDTEKVISELWEGGPRTPAPPGIYIYLWIHFAKSSKFGRTQGMNTYVLSVLELATNLFEVGRLIWGVKKEFSQSRPIQDIRNMYGESTIKSYTGETIDGSTWMPYQAPSFVTPPFPDFPSGHSGFGRVFSNVMTAWFGATIPDSPSVQYDRAQLISPMFSSKVYDKPGVFHISAGSSGIQPGVVPATDITLQYTTWDEMATSSGFSRQYGGIHAMSAHTGSVALSDELVPLVNAAWKFRT